MVEIIDKYLDCDTRDLPEFSKENIRSKQIGGNHYKNKKFQIWDIVDDYELNYYLGNAIKYILRNKNDRIEDLQKAIHYLEAEVERLQNDRCTNS